MRPEQHPQRQPGARKALKQYRERQRRAAREQAEQLQERAARETLPTDDWEPPPRID